VYGVGIDKVKEIMELLNEFELGRKYGKTMTFNDIKYDLDDFKRMLVDNEEFYNEIKQSIINKIKQPKIELADVED
jgi:hypothetical protein